jgi:DNA-binding Lrp family transcriptional regulator|tara:strand:+ start:47 stop:364 length:318 start_codon:yes stop_codon:yes gene_type:complete
MKTIKQLERVRKVHQLIKGEKTDSPKKIALALNISEREVYRILEYLKELGAKINFSRSINSYFYEENFDLLVNVSVKVIINEELKTIYGGSVLLQENFQNLQLNY